MFEVTYRQRDLITTVVVGCSKKEQAKSLVRESVAGEIQILKVDSLPEETVYFIKASQ